MVHSFQESDVPELAALLEVKPSQLLSVGVVVVQVVLVVVSKSHRRALSRASQQQSEQRLPFRA